MPDRTHSQPRAVATKVVDQAQGIVTAIVSVTANLDDGGDVIVPGAFTGPGGGVPPKIVAAHDWSEPIGKVLAMKELLPGDPALPTDLLTAGYGALEVTAQLNLGTQAGKDAFANIAFYGDEQEFSIGYEPSDVAVIDSGDSALIPASIPDVTKAAISAAAYPSRLLGKVTVYEASPVLFGMNRLTRLLGVKSGDTAPTLRDAAVELNGALDRLEQMSTAGLTIPVTITTTNSRTGTDENAGLEPPEPKTLDGLGDDDGLEPPEWEPLHDLETSISYLYGNIDTKANRVLSGPYRDRVQAAIDALIALLDAAEPTADSPPKSITLDPILLMRYRHERALTEE